MNKVELRPYQVALARQGADVLRTSDLLYLAMQVRTGKTLTALSVAQALDAQMVLFITRLKAMPSIQEDYERMAPAYEMQLVNYESLHKVSDIDIERIDIVICDEAHGLGAFPEPAERHKMVKRIVSRSGAKVIFLSGTPTPESYSQMYHQLCVSKASPWADYPTFYAWAKDYVTVRKRHIYNREINDYSDADEDAIREDIKPFFLTFTQEEAGFYVPIEEQVLSVQMEEKTYTSIKRLKRDRVLETSHGTIMADTEVKLLNKLHQICSGTVIVDVPVDVKVVQAAFDHTKAKFIRDHFKGQKIAIFYKFTAEKHILELYFADRIAADTNEFNAGGSDMVYISQIQSGREGLNLSSADCLVMYNIDFSAVSYWQARARIQVKDRVKPAIVYWIFAKGGIEDYIYTCVKKKEDYTINHFRKTYLKK